MGRHDDRAWALDATVLGGLAEFERELIRACTGEGRVRAKANGFRLGRKPTLTHHHQLEAIKRLKAGKETQGEIARSYNVSRWTYISPIFRIISCVSDVNNTGNSGFNWYTRNFVDRFHLADCCLCRLADIP
jgi:DNA invertase Pin-like site-specific DNA recombinase